MSFETPCHNIEFSMVLHFQFDLFSNRNLRASIRIGKDTKKAQSILNREREGERERERDSYVVDFKMKKEDKKSKLNLR